ncbi:hypothetical protein NXS98_16875 [Fontisphaera persica]|uniref:hypothetical protein n=1 Tax=Fontisphaera persica TaxID=2974023 RepID=UPI0024C01484|nr:hypothetical protein [Fontisphaera persica]WCJ59370.1 hypothetical protein NXS98_16875 [Fontisphaera persica]
MSNGMQGFYFPESAGAEAWLRAERPGIGAAGRWWVGGLLFLLLAVGWAGLAAPAADSVKLKVGDLAPPFVAGRWLQGGPLKQPLTNGMAVVLFWTSIEGQGVVGMSRMEGMREKFASRGVTFVGVRVWDHPQEEWEPVRQRAGLVVEMPLMADAVDNRRKGVLAATWLEAAQITAVPVVFVLDRGRIAWMGHPFGLRERILQQLLEGTYPWEQAVAEHAALYNEAEALEKLWKSLNLALENNQWKQAHDLLKRMAGLLPADQQVGLKALQFQMYVGEGRFKEAEALAGELVERYPEEPHLLNLLAWEMATNDDFEKPDYDLILKIAERANAAAYQRDANILDTYARALFLKGRKEEAIQAQTRAVQRAPADLKNKFAEVLRYYQRGELPPLDE